MAPQSDHQVIIPVAYNLVLDLATTSTDTIKSLIEWDDDDLATLPVA